MPLKDANGKLLARNVVTWRNPLRQSLGLYCQKPKPDTAYLFLFPRDVRHAFDMLLVFSPIDVYFLDERKKIVDLKQRFKPFTLYRPSKPYRYAIETKAGMLDLRVGEKLSF